jgi:hypothetical protein
METLFHHGNKCHGNNLIETLFRHGNKLLEQIDHTHAKKMNESKREREKVGENSVY